MSKHTPGPWKVLDRTLIVTTEPWITVCVGSEEEMVAMMNMEDPSIRPGPNARLVSAAPELLELLDRCKDMLPNECGLRDEVYKLIAKVEGV